jgi:S-adenosylmethionine synthetase
VIAVHRPKSVEAVYGKNPTYHSGKVYTLYAEEIAREVHTTHGVGATVTIVATNSNPVRQPNHVGVELDGPAEPALVAATVNRILETADHIALAVDHGRLIPR